MPKKAPGSKTLTASTSEPEHASKQKMRIERTFKIVCCATGTFILLLGVAYLIFYFIVLGSLNCNPFVSLKNGTVIIQNGCTIFNRNVNSIRRLENKRRLSDSKRRLSFADVSRSSSGWGNPPLAYWEGKWETTGSYSIFANQLPDYYLEEQLAICKPDKKVFGCDFYYEKVENGKVVDITNYNETSMREKMIETMYDFENFYWESGDDCNSKVDDYDDSNFRHRFECGAKSFNDGNRFLNVYDVELVKNGDTGIFVIPTSGFDTFLCPGGVRVIDVKQYPVIYIEILAHLYNIFIDGSEDPSTAVEVEYDYSPRSFDDMVSTDNLPCVTRDSVQAVVDSLEA